MSVVSASKMKKLSIGSWQSYLYTPIPAGFTTTAVMALDCPVPASRGRMSFIVAAALPQRGSFQTYCGSCQPSGGCRDPLQASPGLRKASGSYWLKMFNWEVSLSWANLLMFLIIAVKASLDCLKIVQIMERSCLVLSHLDQSGQHKLGVAVPRVLNPSSIISGYARYWTWDLLRHLEGERLHESIILTWN